LARRQLVLAIFEDPRWIDPTSRELLDLTVEWARSLCFVSEAGAAIGEPRLEHDIASFEDLLIRLI
jgi:hypothetical protein